MGVARASELEARPQTTSRAATQADRGGANQAFLTMTDLPKPLLMASSFVVLSSGAPGHQLAIALTLLAAKPTFSFLFAMLSYRRAYVSATIRACRPESVDFGRPSFETTQSC